ncbi:hypothetical protein EDC01DRAFT_655496 [Geopyxis carbonaria]|nr:hypothetical protein EDC01DRAFT_655496 [Geopyxis carbonaria]
MPPKRKRQVEESHHPHSLRLDERRNSKLCELQPTEKILVTTTNSRSTVQIGVHSLSSTTITANPRTFRLSLIPKSVAECSFLEYLGGLECNTGVPTGNILGFSFAPYITWYVATVTFREEPVAFKECHHNKKVYVHLPYKLDERRTVITVDCDFHGLTPLFNPSSSSTQVKFDVVAVSGLSSHAFGSWRSREQYHMMWLRDILPLDFPNFRVFIWGYDSDLNKSTATSSISDFSKRLLLSVYGARCEGEENDIHRPIIFVGHSLGGLVIKQALVEAAQSSSKNVHTILESCIGVFLFGVPNKGLNNENLLSLAKGKNTADFVGSLKEGSELLRSLHAAFRCCYQDYLKACFVVSFYETEDTKSVIEASDGKWKREGKPIRMVTLESATSFMPTEDEHNKIPIASDHSNLVKFTGRDDQNYLAVRSKMKEMIQGFKDYETKPENPAASGPNVKQLSRTDSLDPPQPGPNGSQNKNETKEPVIPEIPLEIGKPVTSIPGELVLTIKAFHAASKRIQGYKTPDEPSDPFFHEFETEKSGFYQHIRYLFDDIVNNMIILRLLANPDSGEWRNVAASTACVPTHPNCSMYLKVVASMTKSIDVFLDHPLDSVEPLNTDKHRESIIQWCHNVVRN